MLDLRFLARRKALSAIAVLTMALALGANTAALSVLKAFLLSSLAVPESDRLVFISPARELPGRGSVVFNEAYPNYELLRKTQHAFADVTVFLQIQASWDDHGEARPLNATRASASFFSTMRVQPARGRAFTAAEEGPIACTGRHHQPRTVDVGVRRGPGDRRTHHLCSTAHPTR